MTNSDSDLDNEMISLSKLLRSILFSVEEKEAIINGELAAYLIRVENEELDRFIEMTKPPRPKVITDNAQAEF